MTFCAVSGVFNLPMWLGAYNDQPWILLMEFNTVVEAEIEVQNQQYADEMLAAKRRENAKK